MHLPSKTKVKLPSDILPSTKNHQLPSVHLPSKTKVKLPSDILPSTKNHQLPFLLSRCKELFGQWESLLEKLNSCGSILLSTHEIIALFNEIDDCLNSMEELKVTGISSE